MLSFGRKKKKEDWQTQGRAVATLKERANASLEVIICVAALLGIGTVMVYSATSVFADNSRYGVDALYFVMKHLQSIVVGVCAGWIVTKIPMSFWQRYALWVFFGALILLVCVLLPGFLSTRRSLSEWNQTSGERCQPPFFFRRWRSCYQCGYEPSGCLAGKRNEYECGPFTLSA